MPQPLIDIEDMVRLLGVSKGRIENAMRKLKMQPTKRIGINRMWKWSDMERVREKILEISPPPRKVRAIK